MARSKFHRPECQQYRLWKKQEALKSKGGTEVIKKKKKDKEAITDCIEEEETKKTEEPLKVNYRKCKKKKIKRIDPRKSEKYVIKCVSFTEIVLKRIKPSLEEREQLINPRHTACLDDGTTKTDLKTVEETSTISPISMFEKDRQKVYERQKSKRKRKQRKESEKVTENKENELRDNGEATEDKEVKEVKQLESKKKRQRRKKKKRKITKPMLNEDSECDSICSFDSEVCLAGLKITSEDKKKLQIYQRTDPSDSNEDKR